MFGATLHPDTRIRPTVTVRCPWKLSVGAHSAIGDFVILDCTDGMEIDRRCTISQYAYLCADGSQRLALSNDVLSGGIHISDDCWVAADAYVGPGVTLGSNVVVGARSSVTKTVPANTICVGDDAHGVGTRGKNLSSIAEEY